MNRFIRVSGFTFFLFGIVAILLRVLQFLILGDPPLEILVLRGKFLALQGIANLVVTIFSCWEPVRWRSVMRSEEAATDI